MDANKRIKLIEIGYRVGSCYICDSGCFEPRHLWGVCAENTYEHEKHTESTRDLSVFAHGWCPGFKLDPGYKGAIHAFSEFIGEKPQ